VNYADIARDVGVSVMTIREWLTILERSFHVVTIAPYYRSFSKRLVKTPKVYFLDSGLHAWLTGWNDPDTALSGPLADSLFENWVVGLLVRGAGSGAVHRVGSMPETTAARGRWRKVDHRKGPGRPHRYRRIKAGAR
jgi:predicted AAA+ superfamily ATPase